MTDSGWNRVGRSTASPITIGDSTSQWPATSPTNYKRHGTSSENDTPPPKRHRSTGRSGNIMSPIHRTHSDQSSTHDQFSAISNGNAAKAICDATDATEVFDVVDDSDEEEIDEGPCRQTEDGDDDDLLEIISSAQYSQSEQAFDRDDDYDSDDNSNIGIETQLHANARYKQPATGSHFVQGSHGSNCNTSRGVSSDASSNKCGANNNPRSPTSAQAISDEMEADVVKDKSFSLRAHERFHKRAIRFIPRLPLADHRYWIGVLNLGKKPKNVRREKHFTWMKGNRFTTISTVWNTYQTLTMRDDFALLLGHERVEFKDRCEELDYFNDKKVILRAVEMTDEVAKGRGLAEGFPPSEVVEIEDD